MGVRRRLDRLEEAAREQATAEVRQALRALADEEMALLVAPYFHKREPTRAEQAMHEKARPFMSEELIARAIDYRGGMPDEEVRQRLGELLEPVICERRAAVYPRLVAMKDGWGA